MNKEDIIELDHLFTDIIQLHFYNLCIRNTKLETIGVKVKVPEGWVEEVDTILSECLNMEEATKKAEFIDSIINQCFEIGMLEMLRRRYPDKPPTWNELIEKLKEKESLL